MQQLIGERRHFYALEADETDDPRVTNAFLVAIDVYLLPRVFSPTEEVSVQKFHLKLDYPTAVNNETLSSSIDQV